MITTHKFTDSWGDWQTETVTVIHISPPRKITRSTYGNYAVDYKTTQWGIEPVYSKYFFTQRDALSWFSEVLNS